MKTFILLALHLAVSLAQQVCSPPCGCFDTGYPWDDRDEPQTWEEQGVEWRLFTVDNPTVHVDMRWDQPTPVEYDAAKATKFLIHGWGGSGDSMTSMKDAFLQNGHDVNVIVVHWATGAGYAWYPQSASNVRVVGSCSAYLARHLVSQEGASMANTHCIGLSLGAQTCGAMGMWTNGTIGRISGLDPAGPWFDTNDTRVRLDASDAQFMDNIHTNVDGDLYLGLGINVGHVDHYPNEGSVQPPCSGGAGCDHTISQEYYRISLAESALCEFPAYPCNSQDDGFEGRCTTCTDGVDCQKMGYYSNTMPGRGTFWLATNADYPYCQG